MRHLPLNLLQNTCCMPCRPCQRALSVQRVGCRATTVARCCCLACPKCVHAPWEPPFKAMCVCERGFVCGVGSLPLQYYCTPPRASRGPRTQERSARAACRMPRRAGCEDRAPKTVRAFPPATVQKYKVLCLRITAPRDYPRARWLNIPGKTGPSTRTQS